MKDYIIDIESENKEISKRYRTLLRTSKGILKDGDKELIRKALDLAILSHKDMRRKSGEPYIYHPIAVAKIAAEEIGLGTTSIVCALLHDVVEDTDVTIEDIEREFGKKVARIISGLTKIANVFDANSSLQAENFRKMVLTLADDVRVILIKLADRLHNMRTMAFMPRDKQLKISSETSYLYAPLAHRLGLYAIKSEMEDLSMKYIEPETYKFIAKKLNEKKAEREQFIREFIAPIQELLPKNGLKGMVVGRPKSIHSIWNKMRKKAIPFEQVYDLFAIRIILDSSLQNEKADCWKTYSLITDLYHPNPDRLRDWVSSPKINGYESLHTTVMGPKGQWVEVQVRTERMNEIAEKGFAAHWKYKEASNETGLDQWIKKVREMLSNPDTNAIEFVDDFKMNLFAEDIYIFTPKGDLRQIPSGSTALDFAFEIHTELGAKCIGAKVNHKLVPLSYVLQNGDQVELLTSSKQSPKEDWLNFVITSKARSRIKSTLKEEKRRVAEDGKEILERKLKSLKINYNTENINKITSYLGFDSTQDLFYQMAKGSIEVKDLKGFLEVEKPAVVKPNESIDPNQVKKYLKSKQDDGGDFLLIGDDLQKLDYHFANCCSPIPGDDVFGFVTVSEGIKIHRTNCPNATKLMSSYAYRVIKAKWNNQQDKTFLAGIKIIGIDDMSLLNSITKVITSDAQTKIRSIVIDSHQGIFEATLMLFVSNTDHIQMIIKRLQQVRDINSVVRFETIMEENISEN